jgi:hypothetical protein
MSSIFATIRRHFRRQHGGKAGALIPRSASSRFVTTEGPQKRTMILQHPHRPVISIKPVLTFLTCLLVTDLPCFAQEAPVSKAIDKSISKTLNRLHLQLDAQYSKLRKSSPERFKLECAAGDCARACTRGQTCSCSTSGTSCSCSACQ